MRYQKVDGFRVYAHDGVWRKVFSLKQRPKGANGRKTRSKLAGLEVNPPENKPFKRHAGFDETLRRQSFLTWGVAPPWGFESTGSFWKKLHQKFVIPVRALLQRDFTSKLARENLNSLK
jgi:hypothetical protein